MSDKSWFNLSILLTTILMVISFGLLYLKAFERYPSLIVWYGIFAMPTAFVMVYSEVRTRVEGGVQKKVFTTIGVLIIMTAFFVVTRKL